MHYKSLNKLRGMKDFCVAYIWVIHCIVQTDDGH